MQIKQDKHTVKKKTKTKKKRTLVFESGRIVFRISTEEEKAGVGASSPLRSGAGARSREVASLHSALESLRGAETEEENRLTSHQHPLRE